MPSKKGHLPGYIISDGLLEALSEDAQQKLISLSEDMDAGKDPSFENVSGIFTKMKYPVAVVGVKDHLGRFVSSWDGAIVSPPMYISFEINDTPFGRAKEENVSRSLMGDYLPVVVTNYEYDGLIYEETVFGYSKDFSTGNPLIAFVRMKVKNPSGQKKDARLSVWFRGTGESKVSWAHCTGEIIGCPKKLSLDGNKILDENGDVVYWSESQVGTFGEDKLSYELSLGPDEEKELYFRIPHRPISSDKIRLLSEPSFDEALEKVRASWKEVVERGMQVDVPEEIVKNAYKTWLINNFLLVQEDKSRQYYEVHDAPFFYECVCGYAASMYLNTITTRGYYEEAKKCADMFIKLQRPDGALSGAGGVIPHQNGSIIYTICQIYRMGRDDEWFRTVVPSMIKACDWIIRERSKNKKMVDGKKPVTYGMLPKYRYCVDEVAGSTDSQEYLGNSWCWAGLNQAAIALGELGGEFEKESIRLKKEADEYRADIFVSMEKAVIKQDDLPFLPIVVENKKLFENLQESRLAHYYNILAPRLLESEIFDTDDERIHWMPDFLERRRGIILGIARFGGSQWGIDAHFIGGYGVTNLRLDRIDRFLLTFYGLISYGMGRTLYSTQEMSSIMTGGNGPAWSALRQPHLHSTSEMTRLLNMMLIKEEKGEVWLAFGTPRKWLEDGKKIEVRKAQICFGAFDFCINSEVSKGIIRAKLSASIKKSPSIIRLKLRHPEGKSIARVEINGAGWSNFRGEEIKIYPSDGDMSVVAYYWSFGKN